MNRDTRFSAIPVGESFEYKGEVFTRFTYFRGKKEDNTLLRFPKHRIVTWLNAYPTQLEA
jgi:hypothetical protein